DPTSDTGTTRTTSGRISRRHGASGGRVACGPVRRLSTRAGAHYEHHSGGGLAHAGNAKRHEPERTRFPGPPQEDAARRNGGRDVTRQRRARSRATGRLAAI